MVSELGCEPGHSGWPHGTTHGHIMTDTTATVDTDPVLRRIRGLLDKAEASTFEEESSALFAKAAELMGRHRITEAMVDAGRRPVDRGKIIQRDILLGSGPYVRARLSLLDSVATASCCKTVTSTGWDGRIGTIIGYETDVAAVDVLYTSLLIQATVAMKAETVPVGENTTAFRRAFLFGFSGRVAQRLREANQVVTDKIQADTSDSVALVLVDRKKAVEEDLFRRYGKLRSLSSSARLGGSGVGAGRAAGGRANLSGRSVAGGSDRAIGA